MSPAPTRTSPATTAAAAPSGAGQGLETEVRSSEQRASSATRRTALIVRPAPEGRTRSLPRHRDPPRTAAPAAGAPPATPPRVAARAAPAQPGRAAKLDRGHWFVKLRC